MITNNHAALSRRAFLSATGALVVALAAPAELAAAESRPFGRSVVRPDTLSSYISIDPDGSVTATPLRPRTRFLLQTQVK